MPETWNLRGWKVPIEGKYFNEYMGNWFIFGKSPDGKFCDIANQDGDDQFQCVEIEKVDAIIEAHDNFKEAVREILNTPC